ncbi:uncharacterized protein [Procambarus clarkii]|uniref:uncharacterized protein n=1 Tax=Procambarus clarkii TaxID=6728 RepID=UPI0037436B4E
MDMESIRKRRARLDAITSSTRLPTLTPLEVFGARPSSVHSGVSSPPNSISSEKRRQQHRHRPDMYLTRKNSASLARAGSGRNTMPALGIPPMTPLHDPLPEIGQTKEDEAADGKNEETIEEKLQERREDENDEVAEEVEEELEGEIEEAARNVERDSQPLSPNQESWPWGQSGGQSGCQSGGKPGSQSGGRLVD